MSIPTNRGAQKRAKKRRILDMKKRFLSIVLAAAMAGTLLAGCGAGAGKKESKNGSI